MILDYRFLKIGLLLFSSSTLLSYVLTPLARKLAFKLKILDYPSKRKIHSVAVPRFGGGAIFLSFLLSLFLYFIICSKSYFDSDWLTSYELKLFWVKLGYYLLGTIIVVIVGALDDIKLVDYRVKLIGQILGALIITAGGTLFHVFDLHILNFLISIIWIVGFTNSMNFLDNMNGLSAGLASIIISFFIFLTFKAHQPLFALFLFVPLGCLSGFLPYNFPKAKIFLGDAGSLFIGISLGTYFIWLCNVLFQNQASYWNVLSGLFFLASIPLIDTLMVIVIRLRNRKPIYVGDTNHLSHQLVKAGLSTTSAVMCLYVGTFFAGAISLIFILF